MNTSVDTVKHLENQAIATSNKFNSQETDFPTRTLPKDMEIHSLESEMELRNQYRAKMGTQSISDYINYFTAHNGENCFINAQNMSAKTIFDLGTTEKPEHCKHKAVLTLKSTAAFNELQRITGKHLSQQDMAEWIEEWHDLITSSSDLKGEEKISLSKAITAIRQITIEEIKKTDHGQSNFRSDRTAMESIEAKSDDTIPSFFHFTCTPYEGLKENTFVLRMSILKSHNAPEFALRVLRFEAIEEELAKEFQDMLAKDLPEDCLTYIGSLEV